MYYTLIQALNARGFSKSHHRLNLWLVQALSGHGPTAQMWAQMRSAYPMHPASAPLTTPSSPKTHFIPWRFLCNGVMFLLIALGFFLPSRCKHGFSLPIKKRPSRWTLNAMNRILQRLLTSLTLFSGRPRLFPKPLQTIPARSPTSHCFSSRYAPGGSPLRFHRRPPEKKTRKHGSRDPRHS